MKHSIIRKSRRTTEQIQYLLKQKEVENISLKDFCKINRISDTTYYSRQKRIIPKSDNSSTNFLPVSIQNNLSAEHPFVEIEKLGGTIVRLYKQVPAEFIKSLI